jgi:hypothetical protein
MKRYEVQRQDNQTCKNIDADTEEEAMFKAQKTLGGNIEDYNAMEIEAEFDDTSPYSGYTSIPDKE